jgi:hypothetical protein
MFGKLAMLQLKVWVLAKRGYQQVEMVGEDNVRNYFYLRPKDDKFDINDGYYMFKPDTLTKVPFLLQKVNPNMAKNFPELDEEMVKNLKQAEYEKVVKRYEAEKEEYQRLVDVVHRLKYRINVATLRWGIPTITYYGTNPEPIDFKEPKKLYDAKVLKQVYLRILLTQKFKELMKWIMITSIAMCIIALALFIYYFLLKDANSTTSMCMQSWNSTQTQLVSCLNETARILRQNATITI